MTTFTELVAVVVVHSSALAASHFGVALATPQVETRAIPASERVVARSHRKLEKVAGCPGQLHERATAADMKA